MGLVSWVLVSRSLQCSAVFCRSPHLSEPPNLARSKESYMIDLGLKPRSSGYKTCHLAHVPLCVITLLFKELKYEQPLRYSGMEMCASFFCS